MNIEQPVIPIPDQQTILTQEIHQRLKAAGETVRQKHPLPWAHPSFRSAPQAARNLMSLFPTAQTFLVLRDPCLRHLREMVLDQGKRLVVPTRSGKVVYEIPGSALFDLNGWRKALKVDPLPKGSTPYTGTVDIVLVACLGWDRHERYLYSYEDRSACILEELTQGLPNGFQLPPGVPVVLMASDHQEVTGWPVAAQGAVWAGAVVTPTRFVLLGDGDESHF